MPTTYARPRLSRPRWAMIWQRPPRDLMHASQSLTMLPRLSHSITRLVMPPLPSLLHIRRILSATMLPARTTVLAAADPLCTPSCLAVPEKSVQMPTSTTTLILLRLWLKRDWRVRLSRVCHQARCTSNLSFSIQGAFWRVVVGCLKKRGNTVILESNILTFYMSCSQAQTGTAMLCCLVQTLSLTLWTLYSIRTTSFWRWQPMDA